jgi:hypothetical protein
MKEYLLLAKGQRGNWDAMSEQQWEPAMLGFETWIKGMKEQNLWIRGDRLVDKRTDIIKKKMGALEVLDGPFTETKEAMTGFFIFRAENLAQAVELAKGCPSLLQDSLQLHELEGDR